MFNHVIATPFPLFPPQKKNAIPRIKNSSRFRPRLVFFLPGSMKKAPAATTAAPTAPAIAKLMALLLDGVATWEPEITGLV